jgi:hypothetical protein
MKTRYEFWLLLLGMQKRATEWLECDALHSSMKSISGFSGAGADFGATRRCEAAADGAGGTKTRRESRLMDSPPFPRVTGFFIPSFWKRRGRHLWSLFWTIRQRRGCANQRHNTCLEKWRKVLVCSFEQKTHFEKFVEKSSTLQGESSPNRWKWILKVQKISYRQNIR